MSVFHDVLNVTPVLDVVETRLSRQQVVVKSKLTCSFYCFLNRVIVSTLLLISYCLDMFLHSSQYKCHVSYPLGSSLLIWILGM